MSPQELKQKRKSLHDLVDVYTQDFPPLYAGPQSKRGKSAKGAVVLVSGTTGAVGANILGVFAQSPRVETVYAISRPSKSGPDVVERHARALVREGYSTDLLASGKVQMIEGDLHLEEFGLKHELYETLVDTVTHIIHNGWQVNLNLPISDFGPNILSVRKLVDFCLRSRVHPGSPAKLIFISTNGVARNGDPDDPKKHFPETSLPEPDSALGAGYMESKWVSEHILDEAARRTPLKPTAARLTQAVGGPNGYWSEKEWFAKMIKSSIFLGKMPVISGSFDYIRADDAARVLLDVLDTEVPYIHLSHPNPVPAASFLKLIAAKLNLPSSHLDEWIEAMVHEHDAAVESAKREFPNDEKARWEAMRRHFRLNPASRIIPFFRKLQETSEGKAVEAEVSTSVTTLLATEVSVRESRTMQNLTRKQMGLEDIERWFVKWKEAGVFLGLKKVDARL